MLDCHLSECILLELHHLLLLVEVAGLRVALHQGLVRRRHIRLIHHALLLLMVLDEHSLVLPNMLHVRHWHLLVRLLADMSLAKPDCIHATFAEHLLVLGAGEASSLTSLPLLLRLGFWLRREFSLLVEIFQLADYDRWAALTRHLEMLLHDLELFLINRLIDLLVLKDVRDAAVHVLVR